LKLGTYHPSVKGPGPLQRGDSQKNAKMGLGLIKIFSRTTGPILTKLGTNCHWGRGFKIVQMKSNVLSQWEIIARVKITLKSLENLLQNSYQRY
jgi:hypothetical protein